MTAFDQRTRDTSLVADCERWGEEMHRPGHRFAVAAAAVAVAIAVTVAVLYAVVQVSIAVGRWVVAPMVASDNRPAFSTGTAAQIPPGAPALLVPVPLGPDSRLRIPSVFRVHEVHGHSAPVVER